MQLTNINGADQMEAGPMAQSSWACAGNNQNLPEIVWKYFGEEITEALREVQQGLAPAKGCSTTGNSQKR